MSFIFSVIVLCPNGRRETVKVSSNCSILQILEEICMKQNLNPQDYDLYHYKKPLDLTLPIRFANLPNNALLELHSAKNSRKDCLVTIALQLESGERIMGDFAPSSTLLDVLKQCMQLESLNSQENGELICIYMRQKISGDAIKTTTLRSLGLTNGTAIIRLLYRKPEQIECQAHVSSPLSLPVKSETKSTPPASSVIVSSHETRCLNVFDDINNFAVKAKTCLNEKTDDLMEMDHNENKTNLLTSIKNKEPYLLKTKSVVDFNNPNVKIESGSNTNQDNDGTNVVDFSVETKEMECDIDKKEEIEELGPIHYIGDRHAVLYSLEDITDVKKADLPDEFFDLTVNDIRFLMEDYKKERSQMENQPLLTSEQRERRLLEKLARYSQTIIRVHFPEKLVFQAVFKATETVQTVCDFLNNFLENKDLKFYLYTTPPKKRLNNTKSLIESMLVPASVVYFGCDVQLPSYLQKNLLMKKSDPRAVALAASEARENVPSIPYEESAQSEIIASNPSSSENISWSEMELRETDTLHPNTVTIPKWLRLSRK